MFTNQNEAIFAAEQSNEKQSDLLESNVCTPKCFLDFDILKFDKVEDLYFAEEKAQKSDEKSIRMPIDLGEDACFAFDVKERQDVKNDTILHNEPVKGLKLSAAADVKNPCKVLSISPFSFDFEFENDAQEILTQPSTQDTTLSLQDMIQNLTIGSNDLSRHLKLPDQDQNAKNTAPTRTKLQKRYRLQNQDRFKPELQMGGTRSKGSKIEDNEILQLFPQVHEKTFCQKRHDKLCSKILNVGGTEKLEIDLNDHQLEKIETILEEKEDEEQIGQIDAKEIKQINSQTTINLNSLALYSLKNNGSKTLGEIVKQESVPTVSTEESEQGNCLDDESKIIKTCTENNLLDLHLQENSSLLTDENEDKVSSDKLLETPCEKQSWKRQKIFSGMKTGSTAIFTCTPLHQRLADEVN